MLAMATGLMPDKTREKVLVDNWPDPAGPFANQVKTRTVYTGVTNGAERNDLIGGNYAKPDDKLPAGSEILLSANHPMRMKHIAWTRQHGRSRVFNFESGHDNVTWAGANFRQVLSRGIAWCAGRI